MKKISTLIIAFAASLNLMNAQVAPMAALNSGDINSLTGVKNLNIVYNYQDVSVGAFRKEEDYLNKKCDDNKKDPEYCDKLKKGWNGARKDRFEPKFEDLFNKYGEKIAMSGKNYSTDQPYTLEIHTISVEPGVNIGIYKKPAYVDMECTFKDNTGKSLCVFFIKNAVGSQMMGYDYDVASRLVESYAKGAKMLVDAVKKARKKAGIKIEK